MPHVGGPCSIVRGHWARQSLYAISVGRASIGRPCMTRHRPARCEDVGVGMRDNRELIEAWMQAQSAHDQVAARKLYAPDVIVDWHQTGERILGLDRVIETQETYPGGLPEIDVHRAVGSEGRWVLDPTFVPRRVLGSGDVWVCEASMTYPNGETWEYATILEIRDGRIVRQTEYWAPRSDAPAWRSHLVERTR